MHSSTLSSLLALVALAALPGTAAAGDAVELRYGYEAGRSYRSVIESVAEARVSTADPKVLAELEALRDLRQTTTMAWSQSFRAGEGEGALTFEATLTELGVSLRLEGEETPIEAAPLAALLGLSLGGSMDARGNLSEVRVLSGDGAGGASPMGEEMATLSPVLPESSLSPGESFQWERAVVFPAPLGLGEEIEGTVTVTYTLRKASKRKAHFDLRAEIGFTPGEAAEALALSGSGEGEAVFDLEGGFFASSELTLATSRELNRPAGAKLEGTTRLVTRTARQ
jgi:hypothetical protein